MRVYILTGTTRGLGRAMAQSVIDAGDHLLSLSRSPDKREPAWHNVECDLTDAHHVAAKMRRLLGSISLEKADELVLINNAGILAPMGPVEDASDEQIVRHLLVNQAAPIILVREFVMATDGLGAQRRIINISSGAARHAYAGLAMYCASKAALDMITACVAAEQASRQNPVVICSISPGKVETGMQRTIRRFDGAKFPARPDFVKAHRQGELNTPEDAARRILALDRSGRLKNGGIYDLRSVGELAGGQAIGSIPPLQER